MLYGRDFDTPEGAVLTVINWGALAVLCEQVMPQPFHGWACRKTELVNQRQCDQLAQGLLERLPEDYFQTGKERVSKEQILEFVGFLKHCGGFRWYV